MPQTVSEKIYEAFFSNLAQLQNVKSETVEGLKALRQANRLADKRGLAGLVQDMENRHAQDQNPHR